MWYAGAIQAQVCVRPILRVGARAILCNVATLQQGSVCVTLSVTLPAEAVLIVTTTFRLPHAARVCAIPIAAMVAHKVCCATTTLVVSNGTTPLCVPL